MNLILSVFDNVVISENERKLLVKKLVENDYFFYIKFRAGFFSVRFKLNFGRSVFMSFYFYARCIHFYVFKSEPAV